MMAAAMEADREGDVWSRVSDLTGLDADLLRSPGLDRWIHVRAMALGIDVAGYRDHLVVDRAERHLFAAQVAVPESWVGRYPASYDVVSEVAASCARAGRTMRVVSIGCAAGQELVSVALAALDAGLRADAIDLHGIDRNREALDRARSGVLPMLAIRGDLAERWSARFSREDGGWRVSDDVHRMLRFHEADVLEDPWPVAGGSVDLVLCRNVLIYLSPRARRRLVTLAVELLAPQGRLLVGHADPPADLRDALAPIPAPGAFAWQRRTADDPVVAEPGLRPRSGSRTVRVERPAAPPRPAPPDRSLEVETTESTETLATIRTLADEGDLSTAKAKAESLAETAGSSADLECLLGEIASADGRDSDAREHWRRALYLDPRHGPSLGHLIGLCEASGDSSAAAVYRRRLDRLDDRKDLES